TGTPRWRNFKLDRVGRRIRQRRAPVVGGPRPGKRSENGEKVFAYFSGCVATACWWCQKQPPSPSAVEMMIAQASRTRMSAPKVKASDAVSNVRGFLLACCSAKATGNRKKERPTGNWFEVSPTQSKGFGTRGSLAFSVPAMNSPRQILLGLFFECPRRTAH